jgi:hypothetical protein
MFWCWVRCFCGVTWQHAQFGRTALNWAARQGHVDCARLLLDAGADKKPKDRVRTSVMVAAMRVVIQILWFQFGWMVGCIASRTLSVSGYVRPWQLYCSFSAAVAVAEIMFCFRIFDCAMVFNLFVVAWFSICHCIYLHALFSTRLYTCRMA